MPAYDPGRDRRWPNCVLSTCRMTGGCHYITLTADELSGSMNDNEYLVYVWAAGPYFLQVGCKTH